MTKNVTIIKRLFSLIGFCKTRQEITVRPIPSSSSMTRESVAKGIFMSLLFVAVIGTSVVAPSSEAWSAETKKTSSIAQNKQKEYNVENFIKEYGTKKTGQTISERVQQAQKRAQEARQKYEGFRAQARETCYKAYEQAIKDRADKAKYHSEEDKEALESREKAFNSFTQKFGSMAGDFFKSLVNGSEPDYEKLYEQAKAAGKDLKNAAVNDWEASYHELAGAYQEARKLWNKTGLNLTMDRYIEEKTEKVKQWFFDDIIGMDMSYEDNAEKIIQFCQDNGHPLSGDVSQALLKLASEAEATAYEKSLMEGGAEVGSEVYQHCYKQKNGKIACVECVVNVEKNTIMSIAGASAGCMPLPFKLYEARSCLFCPLFKVIFNAVQTASSSAWRKVAKSLSTLVMIGLAIWIAWMVLLNVSSMTKQDAPKFLNDLFKASFKIIIIFFLLRSSSLVYDNIIGPLLKAGFEFGTSFLSVSGALGTLPSCKELGNISGFTGGVLPQYVYQHLLCFIEAVQYELATSQAIGSSLMCISVNQGKTNLGSFAKVMPDFSMMFQGALIYGISFILSISFGFYLIDATVQLGIFGVVLPFLLLCYPFKMTKKYFDTGVGVFMNSWFIYVFMGIVVNICMQLIGQGLTGGKGGFEKIEAAINGNYVSELQAILDIGFSGFLILIACCLFAWSIMQKIESIAGKFSSGGLGLGIGNQIGTPALSAAVGLGKEGAQKGFQHVVKPGAKVVGKTVAGTVKGVASVARHPVMTARGVKRALTSKSGFKMLMRGQFRRLGTK